MEMESLNGKLYLWPMIKKKQYKMCSVLITVLIETHLITVR